MFLARDCSLGKRGLCCRAVCVPQYITDTISDGFHCLSSLHWSGTNQDNRQTANRLLTIHLKQGNWSLDQINTGSGSHEVHL